MRDRHIPRLCRSCTGRRSETDRPGSQRGVVMSHLTESSAPAGGPATDVTIRAVVTRLSRPRPSGGSVIERAAILAEGSDAEAIIRWILSHSGRPEAITPPAPAR